MKGNKKHKDERLITRTYRASNLEYKVIKERCKKYNEGKKEKVSLGRWSTCILAGKDPSEFAK